MSQIQVDSLDAELHSIAKQLIDLAKGEAKAGQKRELIERMIAILRHKQVPDAQISAKIKKLTEGYIGESWIRDVCRDNGCTEDSANDGASPEDSSAFVLEVDPDSPHGRQRIRLIWFFSEIISLATMCRKLLNQDYDDVWDPVQQAFVPQKRNWQHFFSSFQLVKDDKTDQMTWKLVKDPTADWLEYEQALKDQFVNIAYISRKCVDERQALLPGMLMPFLAKVAMTSIKNCSTKYYVMFKPMQDITPKKGSQFIKAPETKSDLLHSCIDDSWKLGFLDLKCPDCDKYMLKVRWFLDGTFKLVCTNTHYHKEPKTFPATLLKERLEDLEHNFGGAATRYLKTRGVPVGPA